VNASPLALATVLGYEDIEKVLTGNLCFEANNSVIFHLLKDISEGYSDTIMAFLHDGLPSNVSRRFLVNLLAVAFLEGVDRVSSRLIDLKVTLVAHENHRRIIEHIIHRKDLGLL
jgi:hypothetical protein